MFRLARHTLPETFANAAIQESKYPKDVLRQQCSWEDSETVRRFSSGVTDEPQSIAMRIHGWAGGASRDAIVSVARSAWELPMGLAASVPMRMSSRNRPTAACCPAPDEVR